MASGFGVMHMQMKILGFVTSRPVDPFSKPRRIRVFSIEMPVTPNTTIREIKEFTMKKYAQLMYYQVKVEFCGKIQKDALTLQNIEDESNILYQVMGIFVLVSVPSELFIRSYKRFCSMGMTEENALTEAENFMENCLIKYKTFEKDLEFYIKHELITQKPLALDDDEFIELCMYLEKCRLDPKAALVPQDVIKREIFMFGSNGNPTKGFNFKMDIAGRINEVMYPQVNTDDRMLAQTRKDLAMNGYMLEQTKKGIVSDELMRLLKTSQQHVTRVLKLKADELQLKFRILYKQT